MKLFTYNLPANFSSYGFEFAVYVRDSSATTGVKRIAAPEPIPADAQIVKAQFERAGEVVVLLHGWPE
jgi:hypothetical protein